MRFNDPSSIGSSLLTVDFLMHVSRSRGLAAPVKWLWGMDDSHEQAFCVAFCSSIQCISPLDHLRDVPWYPLAGDLGRSGSMGLRGLGMWRLSEP